MKQLVIVGGGFAGLWAAIAAARVFEDAQEEANIKVISRDAYLTMRPRLYESSPRKWRVPLEPILDAISVRLQIGEITDIDVETKVLRGEGLSRDIAYDRLIVATGSEITLSPVPGLVEHGFSIDGYQSAIALDDHLANLANSSVSTSETILVLGSGFTGIEIATEMRHRLEVHGGRAFAEAARIILVEQAKELAPSLGPGPRGVILAALDKNRVELRTGRSIDTVHRGYVQFSDGDQLETNTVISTIGLRANKTVSLFGGDFDSVGRLVVDDMLRIPQQHDVFVAGDAAYAKVDDTHHALMSCQHAMPMGRHAGYNAASDLLNHPLVSYRQPRYVTCLDLGAAGAVLTRGWEREVKQTGAAAKALKHQINSVHIYPPSGNKNKILASALEGIAVPDL